jgi:hypothetical protein
MKPKEMIDSKYFKASSTLLLSILFTVMLLSGCNDETKTSFNNRAVWLHPGMFSTSRDTAIAQMKELFSAYKEAGINSLFCYNTQRGENGFKWDCLEALISEGHANGLMIHPIFCPGYPVRIEG